MHLQSNSSGPSCSKLTMSLVNVSLKLWPLNMAYTLISCWKNVSKCKSYSHFFSKNACELDVVLTRTVNILTTNKLVKLTTLWTTGPWCDKPKCVFGHMQTAKSQVSQSTSCFIVLCENKRQHYQWTQLCQNCFSSLPDSIVQSVVSLIADPRIARLNPTFAT